jgi:hypothetical protein
MSRISSAEVVDLWLVACYVEIVYAFWLGYDFVQYSLGILGAEVTSLGRISEYDEGSCSL